MKHKLIVTVDNDTAAMVADNMYLDDELSPCIYKRDSVSKLHIESLVASIFELGGHGSAQRKEWFLELYCQRMRTRYGNQKSSRNTRWVR